MGDNEMRASATSMHRPAVMRLGVLVDQLISIVGVEAGTFSSIISDQHHDRVGPAQHSLEPHLAVFCDVIQTHGLDVVERMLADLLLANKRYAEIVIDRDDLGNVLEDGGI